MMRYLRGLSPLISLLMGLALGIGGTCIVLKNRIFSPLSFQSKSKEKFLGEKNQGGAKNFSDFEKGVIRKKSSQILIGKLKDEKGSIRASFMNLLKHTIVSSSFLPPLPAINAIKGERIVSKDFSSAFGELIQFFLFRARAEVVLSQLNEKAESGSLESSPSQDRLWWFVALRLSQAGTGLTLMALEKEHPEIPRDILAPWVLYHSQFWETAIPYLFSSYPVDFQKSLQANARYYFTPESFSEWSKTTEKNPDALLQNVLEAQESFLSLAEKSKIFQVQPDQRVDFVGNVSVLLEFPIVLNSRHYDIHTLSGSKKEVIKKLRSLLNDLFPGVSDHLEEDRNMRLDSLLGILVDKNAVRSFTQGPDLSFLQDEMRKIKEEENFLKTSRVFRKVLENSFFNPEQKQIFSKKINRLYLRIYTQ